MIKYSTQASKNTCLSQSITDRQPSQQSTLIQLRELVEHDHQTVNQLIKDNLHSNVGLIDDLSQHLIQNGGKRLRPLLVLLSANACQYQGNHHILLAAAIEYFHTATLLHDDVIDESNLRRGQATANSIWGSKASILVGDYLFTQAFQLMVKCGNLAILSLLADTANTITCGETKQLMNRHATTMTEQQYFEIIHDKTAILFAAAAQIGPLLIQADPKMVQAFANYGLHLGNAFQLIDDVLDYTADNLTFGKNRGDDLAEGKLTLPLLYALKQANADQQQIIRQAIDRDAKQNLQEINHIIHETGALAYTKQQAHIAMEQAIQSLQPIPDNCFKQALQQLAKFAIERDY